MAKIKLAQLLKAGVHFGHKAYRWNPKMFPYIYTERNGVHILDLIQTAELLKRACDFCEIAAKQNKTFLFVGTKKQASSIIASEATRCGANYVNHRWLGGMLTNWVTLKSRIERLKNLEKQDSENSFENLPKKEVAKLRKELERLRKYFNGVKQMQQRPDIIFIIDQKREITAVKEARSLNIPIITLLDTNCNPDLTTIPIPGNDDAIRSIRYITQKLADSICLGQLTTVHEK
uniref:Small ribosomal subunit protein uS2c n=1 Tax=Schizocladia ischiensis TaxID=196139 RepID=A0A7S6U9Z1_9STRA|nr:ribosomal protein S2 [Schizocladia ischiensis]QOW07525.1 ribosomal protein S2 [Schizocladia ischiensis]